MLSTTKMQYSTILVDHHISFASSSKDRREIVGVLYLIISTSDDSSKRGQIV